MCGIVAIRSHRGPIPAEALRRATTALRHRGPDGERTWISDSGSVGLGHTRLAIIDPVGGVQPIASEDGRRWIIVNGEFYGFEAIRRSLAMDIGSVRAQTVRSPSTSTKTWARAASTICEDSSPS